jgi:RNA polymerase sigma factor (TIGR02999 family)
MSSGDDEGLPGEASDLTASHEVTRLLGLWSSGRAEALEELFPLVYDQLRALAASFFRRERAGHTLQPTALVHEAYFRLTGRSQASVRDRAHFFAVAAQAMRRILVDHARRQRAAKRVDPADRVPLDEASPAVAAADVDLLALHEALDDLAQVNPRQARVVELRYFGGMTTEETAEVLQVSTATVERDWQAARLWLHRQLSRSAVGER